MDEAGRRRNWTRLGTAAAGILLYAVGVNMFTVPLGLYAGGVPGLSQLLRSALLAVLGWKSAPIDFAGVFYYLLNVPLLFIAYRYLGKRFFRNTLICATAYSLFLSLVPVPAEPLVDDMLTGCLLGGVISGVGNGMVLTAGCCGGGLDVLGVWISQKNRSFTIGRFAICFNAALFVLCGILFDVETMIYSILNSIFLSVANDRAHQQSVNVQALIFTKEDSPELNRFIMENLHRGITRWEGKGVYTGENTHILCVCLNKYEIEDLEAALHRADPKAFFIIQEGVHISSNFERRLS